MPEYEHIVRQFAADGTSTNKTTYKDGHFRINDNPASIDSIDYRHNLIIVTDGVERAALTPMDYRLLTKFDAMSYELVTLRIAAFQMVQHNNAQMFERLYSPNCSYINMEQEELCSNVAHRRLNHKTTHAAVTEDLNNPGHLVMLPMCQWCRDSLAQAAAPVPDQEPTTGELGFVSLGNNVVYPIGEEG